MPSKIELPKATRISLLGTFVLFSVAPLFVLGGRPSVFIGAGLGVGLLWGAALPHCIRLMFDLGMKPNRAAMIAMGVSITLALGTGVLAGAFQ